jgi:hypothetical protein
LNRLKDWIKLIRIVKPLRNLRKMRKAPMIQYPQVLPLDAAQLVAEIVKTRKVQERKMEFAHAAWNVQGYIQKVTLGEPSGFSTFGADDSTFGDVMEVLLDIEADLDELEEQGMMMSAANDDEAKEEAGSILVILGIVSAILQAIQLWRNRNREALEADDNDLPAVG